MFQPNGDENSASFQNPAYTVSTGCTKGECGHFSFYLMGQLREIRQDSTQTQDTASPLVLSGSYNTVMENQSIQVNLIRVGTNGKRALVSCMFMLQLKSCSLNDRHYGLFFFLLLLFLWLKIVIKNLGTWNVISPFKIIILIFQEDP